MDYTSEQDSSQHRFDRWRRKADPLNFKRFFLSILADTYKGDLLQVLSWTRLFMLCSTCEPLNCGPKCYNEDFIQHLEAVISRKGIGHKCHKKHDKDMVVKPFCDMELLMNCWF